MSTPLRWRKSSRSNPCDCIELAWPPDSAAIRDSKNPTPTRTLTFAPSQLAAFLATLKAGVFDLRG